MRGRERRWNVDMESRVCIFSGYIAGQEQMSCWAKYLKKSKRTGLRSDIERERKRKTITTEKINNKTQKKNIGINVYDTVNG